LVWIFFLGLNNARAGAVAETALFVFTVIVLFLSGAITLLVRTLNHILGDLVNWAHLTIIFFCYYASCTSA
jgi:hypothetical protein